MMSEIWAELGVAPGSDRDAIRRAYAGKLRQTNPEDDPVGFQRLRQAYELALKSITRPISHLVDSRRADAMICSNDVRASVGTQAEGSAIDTVSTQEEIVRLRRELDQLAAEFVNHLDSEQPERLAQAESILQRLLASPALDDLSVRLSVEHVISHQIAASVPRSDRLIARTAERFDWNGTHYRESSPAVAAVVRRSAELAFVAAVAKATHPLHKGWKALALAGASSWRRRLDAARPGTRDQVDKLLSRIKIMPGLSLDLDQRAITWWTNHICGPRIEQALAITPFCFLELWVILLSTGVSPANWKSAGPTAALSAGLAAAYVLIAHRLRANLSSAVTGRFERGWMVALALVVLVAVAIPAPWDAIAVVVLTVLTMVLLDLVKTGRSSPDATPRLRFGPTWLPHLSMIFILSFGISSERLITWLLVVATLAIAWRRGHRQVAVMVAGWKPRVRRAVAGTVGLAAGSATYLFLTVGGQDTSYRASLCLAAGSIVLFQAVDFEPVTRQKLCRLVISFAVISLWIVTRSDSWTSPLGAGLSSSAL